MSALVTFRVETYNTLGKAAFDAFKPKPDFTIENARALMWFAQLAYEADLKEKVEVVGNVWGFRSMTPFIDKRTTILGSHETYGLLGEGQDAIILAFGGTDLLVWRTLAVDLQARISRDDVHEGFEGAAAGVKSRVADAVTKSRQLSLPLVIAGHSLGGAVAALAAERASRDVPVEAVYTFGMPRTGGEQFKTRYDNLLGSKTYRLVHGRDLVASIPPSVPAVAPYRHVGRLLQCDSGAAFEPAKLLPSTDSNEPEFGPGLIRTTVNWGWSLLRGQISGQTGFGLLAPLFPVLPLNIRDHLQDSYLRALGVKL